MEPMLPSDLSATPQVTIADRPAVSIVGLSKSFAGMRALNDVSLQLMDGEIHALVGGNGSGKSTLVKALAGVQAADAGTIRFRSEEVPARDMTPALSRKHGVRVVHQDLGVFPTMSVMENLALGSGYQHSRLGRVRWRLQRRRAAELIERFQIATSPDAMLADISATARTQVAIARALQDQDESSRGLLILDEPTAALPAHEVGELLAALRRYSAMGQSILYISHRLNEILDLTDRVTALRDGVSLGTRETSALDERRLVELIVAGREDSVFIRPPALSDEGAAPAVEIRGLAAGPLSGIDLTVRRGEIVGVAGLLGSGRSELLRAVFGDLPIREGSITLQGFAGSVHHPRDAIDAGVAFVPENRVEDAAFPDLPIYVNFAAVDYGEYRAMGLMRDRRMRAAGRTAVRRYGVKTDDEGSLLSTLSGGNQQKTIVGRWLRRTPSLLLLDEPTQGVDVGARADIYRLIHEAVAEGAAAIIVASDFEELAHVVHRAIILRDGRLVAEVSGAELTPERLLELTSARNGEVP